MDAQNTKDRIKQRVKSAVQTKLTSMGLKSEKAENLAPVVTDLIAEGKTKEEINTTLKALIGEEYYKPSFTDWLFGYATFFNVNQSAPVAESANADIDISSDEEEEEEEEKKEEKPVEETKAQSQKNTLVKRRLSRSASSLDLASEVQKEVYGQAMAIAATTESLNKKQEKTIEKKKSFSRRRESGSYAGSESGEKSHIRCQYWPNCNRGETCKFWHPKELCRKYPNCPDGDHCLYIHPAPLSKPPTKPQSPAFSSHASDAGSVASNSSTIECKFGANCTRPDCKFSHPSPAAIVAMMAAKQQQQQTQTAHSVQSKASSEDLSTINIPCRYEPNCSRADCRFLHTKPRKF